LNGPLVYSLMSESNLYRSTKSSSGFGFDFDKLEVRKGDGYVEIARDRVSGVEKNADHIVIRYDNDAQVVVDITGFEVAEVFKLFGILDYDQDRNWKRWDYERMTNR